MLFYSQFTASLQPVDLQDGLSDLASQSFLPDLGRLPPAGASPALLKQLGIPSDHLPLLLGHPDWMQLCFCSNLLHRLDALNPFQGYSFLEFRNVDSSLVFHVPARGFRPGACSFSLLSHWLRFPAPLQPTQGSQPEPLAQKRTVLRTASNRGDRGLLFVKRFCKLLISSMVEARGVEPLS